MKLKIIFLLIALSPARLFSQGKTHHFLIGYGVPTDSNVIAPYGQLLFDNTSITTIGETRKMAFRATQGNISDENGNLLMVSNGCWIADATGDTMQWGGA